PRARDRGVDHPVVFQRRMPRNAADQPRDAHVIMHQSSFNPRCRMSSPQRLDSAARNCAVLAGEVPTTNAPKVAKRLCTASSVRTPLMSLDNFSMQAGGDPPVVQIANHADAENPG